MIIGNTAPISSSLEDYMEAIAEIIEKNGHAHTKDIAERLKVTMPSVTNALQALSVRGLVVYSPHQPVELTPEGAQVAMAVCNRHHALRNFFSQVLCLDETTSDESACKVEHVIGETAMARLVALSKKLEEPGLAGLRKEIAALMEKIVVDESSASLVQLDKLKKDRQGIVTKISGNLVGLRKFANLGLIPGALVRMQGKAPLGDLIRIKVMGASLSMRKHDARHIWLREVR